MNKIIINSKNGKLTVSSLQVATDFGKQHKNVVQSIENLKAENSALKNMFIESTYKVEGNNKTYKCYDITRDGFSLLVMGFTGKKALEWKLKYIEAFNLMEKKLHDISYKQLSFEDKPEYEYYDKTYNGKPVLTLEDIGHLFNVTRHNILYYLENKSMNRGTDYYLLKEKALSNFKAENPKIAKMIPSLIVVEKSGFVKLCKIMNVKCDMPECYCIEEKKENDIVAKILKDLGIKKCQLTKELGETLLGETTTATGNSVLVHNFDTHNGKIYFDVSSGTYEKLVIIMKNVGFQLLGGFRKSIDGKPVLTDEIRNEAKIFSAVFLALKMFADYGGFDNK